MKVLSKTAVGVLIFLISGTGLAMIGGGDVVFKAGRAKDAVFSHEKHVADIGLGCTECHDALYTSKGGHKKVTMAQMGQGQSCGACHDGKMAFDVKGNCSHCHTR
jgi:c(7)-type cytochrome triheme protein